MLPKLINGGVLISPGGGYADFPKINKRAPPFIRDPRVREWQPSHTASQGRTQSPN